MGAGQDGDWSFKVIMPSPNPSRREGDLLLPQGGRLGGGASFADIAHTLTFGRTDFPRSSYEDLERSIKERLYTLPDELPFYSGHGGPGTIGEEKRTNPFVRAE